MGKYNLGDLVKRGQEHVDEYENWEPPKGLNLKCSVAKCIANETDQGLPRWSFMLKVEKGEYEGKTFWKNVRFSEEWDFMNKATVDAFEGLGISADFLASNDPEMAAAAAEGKKVVVSTDFNKKGYENHTFEAARASAPPPPPVEVEDDDDDDYWADNED